MAKQSVKREYATPWKPQAAGESMTGLYLGTTVIPAGPKVEKAFTAYIFKGSDDKTWSVSGDALKYAMERIPKGVEVEIVFEGKKHSEKRNRQYNSYDVRVDDSVALLNEFDTDASDDFE